MPSKIVRAPTMPQGKKRKYQGARRHAVHVGRKQMRGRESHCWLCLPIDLLRLYLIMSTAPKLTYAKIGNKSRAKVEPNSTELIRHQQQRSQDIFSQMNQDNLNYIKKELKLKKNRSEHDRTPASNDPQEQPTQREKILYKYKGDEVPERDPHLEDTERRSSQGQPLQVDLPQQPEEQTDIGLERRMLSTSQNADPRGRTDLGKMYHSLPYEQPKRRVVSIEGYFRESASTNLQKVRQDGNNFIEFLEDYISDLNQSKHLKSRPFEESIDKKPTSKQGRQSPQRNSEASEERMRDELIRLERFKRNSDTFGQPNSKYTVHSSLSYDPTNDLPSELKRQRFNCLILAQQLESLKQQTSQKSKAIKQLQLTVKLQQQQIAYLKARQDIILKSRAENIQRQTKRHHDQNNDAIDPAATHQRRGSAHPTSNKHAMSSRRRARDQDPADFSLFQQFADPGKQRGRSPQRASQSIEKVMREYNSFTSDMNNFKAQKRRYK